MKKITLDESEPGNGRPIPEWAVLGILIQVEQLEVGETDCNLDGDWIKVKVIVTRYILDIIDKITTLTVDSEGKFLRW